MRRGSAGHRYGCTPAAPVVRPAGSHDGLVAVCSWDASNRGRDSTTPLDAWIASAASEQGRLLVFGAVDDDYLAVLADRLAHPSVELRGVTASPGRGAGARRRCSSCRASRRAARS
jgi:hypothetical protein